MSSQRVKNDSWSLGITACILAVSLVLVSFTASAEDKAIDSLKADEVYLQIGELETIKVHSLTRLSIVSPGVADIVNADDQEILLIGKTVGETPLFLWDEHGKRALIVRVVKRDLSVIKGRIENLLKTVEIDDLDLFINETEGKIVIRGELPKHKKKEFDKVIGPFEDDIMLLARHEKIDDLIQIDMQVTELNTTLSKAMGISWGTFTSGANSGSVAVLYKETLPALSGEPDDWFKIGDFTRQNPISATVNALVQDGQGRVLSKPKLVVVSGQTANFLVGGEVPIRTTSATSSGFTENISFKSYGVSMDITPTIRRDLSETDIAMQDKIDIDLNVNVSDVDASVKVGNDVGFTTRTASTKLYLEDGQTIVLAGLIKHNDSEITTKIPFLGNIPVVGKLFRNTENPSPDKDEETVITLRPTILSKGRNRLEKERKQARPNLAQINEEQIGRRPMQNPTVQSFNEFDDSVRLGIPQEMARYVHRIQEQISRSITYPQEAQDYGWEGTVKVGLHILNDGTLAYAMVRESSGYEVFDEYALKTAKNVAPYSGFPADTNLRELNITIPIVYSLE